MDPFVKVEMSHFAQRSHSFSDVSLHSFLCNTFSIGLRTPWVGTALREEKKAKPVGLPMFCVS